MTQVDQGEIGVARAMEPVSIEGVSKVFDRTSRNGREVVALTDVSFEIGPTELVCVLGSSGCGKTTLLNIIAGFVSATEGRVVVGNIPVDGIDTRCGVLFQDYALFPWKTVRDNITFPMRMAGVPRSKADETVRNLLELVALSGFEKHYPSQISGGMKQRVALARALAQDPMVLLLDEPFSAVDAMARRVLQDEFLRIHLRQPRPTLLITHDIDEAILLSDRMVILRPDPGRIAHIIDNDLPRPRKMNSADYMRLRETVWNAVAGDVRAGLRLN